MNIGEIDDHECRNMFIMSIFRNNPCKCVCWRKLPTVSWHQRPGQKIIMMKINGEYMRI